MLGDELLCNKIKDWQNIELKKHENTTCGLANKGFREMLKHICKPAQANTQTNFVVSEGRAKFVWALPNEAKINEYEA